MKKRILSILLLCCMVLGLLPTTAFATGELRDSTNVTVTFDSTGGSAVEPQSVTQGQLVQRPADPIKDGYTFIGWYNKDDLQYSNMPEWDFSYPVTKDLELVAQWMPKMPISTEPITYLDKDGKQQVCNEYTVLTSETKESILDYADKWYDLPAGWYVVKGDVTITPRVDTHGAVNLILTDGSHLTAEWGINVKKDDTFTVYAQSTGEDTMGRLTACLPEDFNSDGNVRYYVWPDRGLSGIGAGKRCREANIIYENEGTIIINGGNIQAKGQRQASAIGGPYSRTVIPSQDIPRQGGTIIINGGIVRTEALEKGNDTVVESVGIGTCQFGYGGSVTINGGTVIAEAANDAITTGQGGSITINGGDVTAHGGINNFEHQALDMLSGNGIGPYFDGTVTINGGHVKALADGYSCGIGGHGDEVTVTITGGTVEAVAANQFAAIGGKGSVTITGGVINAAGKNNAAGIGSNGDIHIIGGEITVSAEGLGAAIGGYAGVDCGSITIQGNVIKSVISSGAGACIGGASNRSAGSITISNAKLPPLNGTSLIGWISGNTAGSLTIRNCYIESTDTAAGSGIQVSDNGNIRIENSEVRLPEGRDIRAGNGGSIVIRDSTIHSNGIYMLGNLNEAKNLKRLEITGSTVVTAGNVIGAMGSRASVDEIVIHGSSLSPAEGADHYYAIGGGEYASFGSIDIQGSQINIPLASKGAAIGGGNYATYSGESTIRIANSQVIAATGARLSAAIGTGNASQGTGSLKIFIESSNVTAKGGPLRQNTDYVPGIGKYDRITLQVHIQVMNSTVESFRHTKRDSDELVYDDLHEKNLPGIPAENITICGSTVNGKTIDHSFDEYGKCTLCGKYDIGYCYENGLLTMEGLTDCVYDGSEKKLTGLSHRMGENETKQLAENTDYTADYSNNVHPYTLTPDDEGFDSEKAPKVTLYGTGNYCGKAEHYFTISAETPVAEYTVTVKTDGNGTASASPAKAVAGTAIALTATPNEGYRFKEWAVMSGGVTIKDNKFLMPDSNVEVKAIFEEDAPPAPTEYTVTVTNDGNGTASASPAKAVVGTAIALTATPNTGYRFKEWQVISGGVSIENNKFLMPDSDVEVKAIFEEDAPPVPDEYTVRFNANGGGGTMADVTGVSGSYTLPACGFTEPEGKQFKGWSTGADGSVISGTTYEVSSDTTFYAIWESKEYSVIVTDGKATIGAGSEINKAVQGTTITLTANAAPDGKVFDKWVVESGSTTLEDANSETTTFIMPDSEVSVKATYKNAPVTTYSLTTQVNGGHGTISASKTGLTEGSAETVIFTPDDGYEIDIVTVNGAAAEVLSNILNVTMDADKTVIVTYKAIPHTHTYDQEIQKPEALKSAADCTNDEVYFKSCSCGDISTTETFTAAGTQLGHAWASDWSKDTDNHWKECSRCHEKKDEAAHDYGSDNICDACGYDKTVPHMHNLTLVPAKAPTCTEKGNTAYYTCDGCDKWFEDATGASEITDKTSVILAATGHSASDWKSDNIDHWKECTVVGCGVIIEDSKAAHTAGEWIIDTPATAETDGSKHKECTVCGYTMTTEAIPATGGEHTHSYGSEWKNDADNHWHECSCGDKKDTSAHTAGEWIIDTPATATTSGSKHKECTVCGYMMTTEAIPATGGEHTHSYGSKWKNDADNHWHECSCGDKKDTSAHTAGEWIIDTPATAETDGSKHKECTVCGYTMTTEAIPATGGEHTHSYGSKWKNDADNHWHECSCGDKKDTSAHTAGEWIIDTPATAETDGSKHKECTVCGYTITTEAIPATGIPTEPGKPIVPNSPQTGDNSNIILWIALLFISGGTVIGITVYSKKKKENAE